MTSQHAENHNGSIYTTTAMFSTLSLIALVLRLMSRRLKKITFYYDDYLAIAAGIVTIIEGAVVAASTRFGGLGYHLSDISVQQVNNLHKALYALSFCQYSSLAMAKISVLIQLYRIFVTKKFRMVICILGAIVMVWWLSSMFAFAFICTPIESIWNPNVSGKCGNVEIFNLVNPLSWIITDFVILFVPIPMIRRLQLSKANKIGLCALFLTGGFTCIVACIRFSKLLILTDDETWSSTQGAIWSVIETNVTVICACIVAIRPAIKYLFPERLISSARDQWSRLWSSYQRQSYDSPHALGESPPGRIARPPEDYPHRLSTLQYSNFNADSKIASMERIVTGHCRTPPGEVV